MIGATTTEIACLIILSEIFISAGNDDWTMRKCLSNAKIAIKMTSLCLKSQAERGLYVFDIMMNILRTLLYIILILNGVLGALAS